MRFEATPIRCIYNSENYKIYACDIDTAKYKNIKLNQYFNVTIVGDCGELTLNMLYDIDAEEKQGKYGFQYLIKSIKQQKPMSERGLREFLCGCGLSSQQVAEVVREYPNIIELVMNNETDKIDINKLYNIGAYRINVIIERIQSNFMLAELVERCGGYFSFNIIKKLFDKYGATEKIVEELENNPYQCLCNISRIGFKTADTTLLTLEKKINTDIEKGLEPPFKFNNELRTSKDRCLSALEWLLDENEANGNTIFDIKTVGKELKNLVPECFNHFVDICKNANDDEKLSKQIYVDLKNKWIANTNTHYKEEECAKMISQALHNPTKWNIDIEKYRCNDNIKLTDEQLNTLQMVCDNNISVLSGYSGTGKSSSVLALIKMLKDNNKSFLLMTPTGKSAKVLANYTHEKTSTIHKLLFSMQSISDKEDMKLNQDIVIVDETSMCDISLFYDLLSIIDIKRTKLLLIGDPAQLSSIGCGCVLHDIINSNKVYVNSLTKIFRYGESSLLTVATDVRNGQSYFHKKFTDSGYVFIDTPQETMLNKLKKLYAQLLLKGYKKEDILILSSYNKGNYGTIAINNMLQPIANKNINNPKLCKKIKNGQDTITYAVGDIVIQTKNNYKANLCNDNLLVEYDYDGNTKQIFVPNGETGTIKDIISNRFYIQFEDGIVCYDLSDMVNVKLSYSISTHKSQGSQSQVVIVLTPKSHTFFLTSNLLYVAITRGCSKVFHFGDKKTVNIAIKKKDEKNRKTWLKEYIIEHNRGDLI